MASTEVLGESRAAASDSLEQDVLESETISGENSPADLLDAMTRTVATQILDDQDGTSPGGEHEAATRADGSDVSSVSPRVPSSPGPATRIEIHNSGEPDDRSGEVIHQRYQLVRMLGKGGMGTVYIAQHTALPKTFAVKVLNARYAKRRDIAERFLQEAQAVSMIEHENVVGVIDFGKESDGTAFLVMEHLRGEALSTVCKRDAPLPWPRVQHIMDQMCRALQAAHDVGIVHRDIKPENVLRVGRHGDPDFIKILDFGLAKMQISGGLRLTQTGMVLGTPDYMSPEQARGRPTDHRADIYASGVMMYELLSGRVPFSAKTFRAMRDKHLFEPPDPPSKKAPGAKISQDMDAIVLRALAKDPDHRFANMTEMREAITAVGTGRPSVPLIERGTLPLLDEHNLLSKLGANPRGGTLPMRPTPRYPGSGPGPAASTLDLGRGSTPAQATPAASAPGPKPAAAASLVAEPASPSRGWLVPVLVLVALGLAGGAWAVLAGPFATQPETAPAPAPAQVVEPERPSSHATVRFVTNVPVKILDADEVPRFGDRLRSELLIPLAERPVQLILRAEGYRDLHVVVTPDRDQELRYRLEALEAGTEPPLPEVEIEAPALPPTPSEEPAVRGGQGQNKPKRPIKPPEPEPEPEPAGDEGGNDHSFSPEIVDPFNNN